MNAIFYFVPPVSLIWLGIANKIDVPNIHFLIIGTVLILLSNILINYKQTPGEQMSENNRIALQCMLITVMLFSIMPVTFIFGSASKAPFLFIALMQLSAVVVQVIYLFNTKNGQLNQQTFQVIIGNIHHPAILIGMFGLCTYVIYAFSLRYIEEAIATVLMQTSAIFTVLLMARLFKKENRYTKITMSNWILFALAFIGVIFVILSQSPTLTAVNQIFTPTIFIGVGLAILSALLASILLPMNQLWGSHISRQINTQKNEIFYTIIANSTARIIITPVFILVGLYSSETFQSIGAVGILTAVVYGTLGLGLATILIRVANFKTSNLGINALFYLIPAFSLLWLALTYGIDVPRIDWLIIGLTMIISSNFLININHNPKNKNE